ncbi:MAG TPA: hypothetical protein VGE11_08220 [Pseudonocardia sp.]
MTVSWSSVFRRSPLGVAVFDVAPEYRHAVLAWAAAQDVPTVRYRELHVPAVEAWAVLDGGVTSLEGYGATSLPCGVRVVGFQVLRLLIADLSLAGPHRPFDGETALDHDELRRRHTAAGRSPSVTEQAELLASCHDAVLLRWVAATLLESAQAAAARSAR